MPRKWGNVLHPDLGHSLLSLLDQVATVYSRNPGDPNATLFSEPVVYHLPCRVAHQQEAQDTPDLGVEQVRRDYLIWPAQYQLPTDRDLQVQLDGLRYDLRLDTAHDLVPHGVTLIRALIAPVGQAV